MAMFPKATRSSFARLTMAEVIGLGLVRVIRGGAGARKE